MRQSANGPGRRADTLPTGVAPADGPSWPDADEDAASMVVIGAIPGGQLEARQMLRGSVLMQQVSIRRPDGSVWTAYERDVTLPEDESPKAVARAGQILFLASRAVCAADTARIGRFMLANDAARRNRREHAGWLARLWAWVRGS